MPARRRTRAFAPGRVNLIGEHTDYNDGLCLPLAIADGVTVTVEPDDERVVLVDAADLGEHDEFDVAGPAPARAMRCGSTSASWPSSPSPWRSATGASSRSTPGTSTPTPPRATTSAGA